MDDRLSDFDPARQTSGHEPPAGDTTPASLAAEHQWSAAAAILFPVLRPAGSGGRDISTITLPTSAAGDAEPLVEAGPCGLVVSFAMHVGDFHVLASGDHLASWNVMPADVRATAMANLAAWSEAAPWSEDASGRRRVVSSDTGDGWDASRILLPETIAVLVGRLGRGARVLVGLPASGLLVAGPLYPDDPEFGPLFADFVLEYSGDSDEPIDRRVFEIVGGRLVEFSTIAAGAAG
jgi:hypothetical protein